MQPMGLNQMTMARSTTTSVIEMAQALGCVGVELRNDLVSELFDGRNPVEIREEVGQRGLRILALAEVYAFNDNTNPPLEKTLKLLALARDCGAEAIALIPSISEGPIERAEQRAVLKAALETLRPMLEGHNVVALIEPLGFAHSSLRFKEDAVAVLDDMGRPKCFSLIHDTFHHTLSGETTYYPEATRIVHISGVSDQHVELSAMTDAHRGLVNEDDRLGSVNQISSLLSRGYTGPFSFEAFSSEVHDMTDPTESLLASTAFINSQVAKMVA